MTCMTVFMTWTLPDSEKSWTHVRIAPAAHVKETTDRMPAIQNAIKYSVKNTVGNYVVSCKSSHF